MKITGITVIDAHKKPVWCGRDDCIFYKVGTCTREELSIDENCICTAYKKVDPAEVYREAGDMRREMEDDGEY